MEVNFSPQACSKHLITYKNKTIKHMEWRMWPFTGSFWLSFAYFEDINWNTRYPEISLLKLENYYMIFLISIFFTFLVPSLVFFFSWRLITLQYCSGFCHTLKWISHGFTCVPHPDAPSHLPLHPIPLGLPSAPGPSASLMHPTWAGDLFH